MAVKNDKLGGTDYVNGTVADAGDMNDTFDEVSPCAKVFDQGSSTYIYTGTDWDASASSNTVSNSKTFQISSTELRNANFIEVNITYYSMTQTDGTGTTDAHIHIERQETGGGGFTDAMAEQHVSRAANQATHDRVCSSIRFLIATTSGERTNGIDIKITGKVECSSGETGQVNNIQTWFKGVN